MNHGALACLRPAGARAAACCGARRVHTALRDARSPHRRAGPGPGDRHVPLAAAGRTRRSRGGPAGLDALLGHAREHRPSTLVTELLGIGDRGCACTAAGAPTPPRSRRCSPSSASGPSGADDCLLRGEAATLRAHYSAVFSTRGEPRSDRRGGGAGHPDRPGRGRARARPGPTGPRRCPARSTGWFWCCSRSARTRSPTRSRSRRSPSSNGHRLGDGPADPPAQPGPAAAVLGAAAGARRPGRRPRPGGWWGPCRPRRTRPGCGRPRSAGTAPAGCRPSRSARSSPPPTRCTGPDPATSTPSTGCTRTAHYADDRILLAIATARCLLADDRPAAAVSALAPLRDELGDGSSEVGAHAGPAPRVRAGRRGRAARRRARPGPAPVATPWGATPPRWRPSCGRCTRPGSPRCAATARTTGSAASTARSPASTARSPRSCWRTR